MRFLCIVVTIGGLVLVSGPSHGAEPAPPAAAIQPAAKDFLTVYGQVMLQGKYELKPPMTVPQALQMAGGLTVRGNPKKVKLIRKPEGRNVTILIKLGGIEAGSFLVKPGDVIIVDEVLTDF